MRTGPSSRTPNVPGHDAPAGPTSYAIRRPSPLLAEIEKKGKAHRVGERMVLLERIDVREVDADEAVPNTGTERQKLTVAVVRVLVEVAHAKGEEVVVPVLRAGAD